MKHIQVDLTEKAESLEERASEIAETQAELVEKANSEYESPKEVPDALHDTYEELEEKRLTKQGLANIIREKDEEYGGSTYTIQEMSTGGLARVQDSAGQKVQQPGVDMETGEGAAMVEVLRETVIGSPPDAPDDVGEFPWRLSEALMEYVEALNTTGEAEMGNSSLREAMKSSRS